MPVIRRADFVENGTSHDSSMYRRSTINLMCDFSKKILVSTN